MYRPPAGTVQELITPITTILKFATGVTVRDCLNLAVTLLNQLSEFSMTNFQPNIYCGFFFRYIAAILGPVRMHFLLIQPGCVDTTH